MFICCFVCLTHKTAYEVRIMDGSSDVCSSDLPNRTRAEAILRRQLYGVVTAVRDMADDLRAVGDLARASLVGEIPAPDIYYAALMAGPPFFADPRVLSVSRGFAPGTAPWMPAIDAETDLRTAVKTGRASCRERVFQYV